MNFTLIKATEEQKPVLNNLMQFYIYDFSEYIEYDVGEDGLFAPYPHLEDYWKEDNSHYPYLIEKHGKYIGFVLVKLIGSEMRTYFSIAEFFIMKKYRREGIGRAISFEIFNMHRGNWQVYQRETNKPAQIFWNKVIGEYTNGMFEECYENERHIQNFKS